MSTTLYQLRQQVGLLLGSGDMAMVTGTPSASFATTGFQCPSLALEEDDYYNDWYLRFYSGTHKGTTVRVTDFAQADGAITFSPALSTVVDETDLFELHRDFSPEEMNNAINLAIQAVEMEALEDKTDESLTIVSGTWEYAVPSGFVYIDAIYQVSDTDSTEMSYIDLRHWQVINKSGTKYLWFDKNKVSLTADYTLRITGQSKASTLTLDAGTTEISTAFLVQQAKALLHQQRIDGTGGVSEAHDKQMALAQTMADRERPKLFVTPRGWKV